ncbi:conserved hypothetical protein [Thermosyntropha lipolytica DSM 11003]|uniref:Purine nucleoside phosphorylase n=1 Tax=Thermosyntropha lipolytica DSM 11003 TaxID=1123382 RepID=A0A1M5K802_9FIRM|nr:peptidoglycan editing factor PgeF [Thermosyntropha lipolytica]SHG48954.1 conserved hypothetical protein [Thermosyntropha lipolytica DSM 11003]
MQKWIWHNKQDIAYITVPSWQERGVNMLFSSRKGGVSLGPFSSLNLGLHVGDEKDRVEENRRRVLALLGTSPDQAVCCEQVHGNEVALVGREHRGRGVFDYATAIAGCDAMVTAEPDLYLITFYADCISLYFYDPVRKAIGLAHSGWKGTISGIAAETIRKMQEAFKSSPSHLEVFIGPGIGKCCFEISPDLAVRVERELGHLGDLLEERDNAFYWDLKETNRRLLIESGIKPENIIVCDLCTACCSEYFFSYRRDKGLTGRMAAVIGMRK